MEIIYHRRVALDLRTALRFYDQKGGTKLADRFFAALEAATHEITMNPAAHHFADAGLRRIQIGGFPYHMLYEVDGSFVWVGVLRHDRRRPSFGLLRFKRS